MKIVLLILGNSVAGYLLACVESNYLLRKSWEINPITAPAIYLENLLNSKEKMTGKDARQLNSTYIMLSSIFGPLPRIAMSIIAILLPPLPYFFYFIFWTVWLISNVAYALFIKIPMPSVVEKKVAMPINKILGDYWHNITNKEVILENLRNAHLILLVSAAIIAIIISIIDLCRK